MRVVLTDGAVYHVRWEHVDLESLRNTAALVKSDHLVPNEIVKGWLGRFGAVTRRFRAVSIAHVEYRGEGGSPVLQYRNLIGEACCGSSDQFEKSAGRKISLGRAIAGLSKKDRTAFWKALLTETRMHRRHRKGQANPAGQDGG